MLRLYGLLSLLGKSEYFILIFGIIVTTILIIWIVLEITWVI